jgi:peptidoglycan/xylan/chitin deacetylase (PgdA/CDA1 family)
MAAMASRRRWLIWSGAALALLLIAAFALWRISADRCFVLTGEIICRVETSRPMVALTFDDGPTEEGVALALPALAARGTHATFFLIGEQVVQRPQLVGQILAQGHEIGNHSMTHRRMVGRSAAFYDREIGDAHRALMAAGAPAPVLFRPPYGKKLWGLPMAVARHGYRMVMIDVEEPTAEDPRAYAEQIVRDARPGSILLMHLMYRGNRVARDALPLVLDGLRARGFRIVSVGELIAAAD